MKDSMNSLYYIIKTNKNQIYWFIFYIISFILNLANSNIEKEKMDNNICYIISIVFLLISIVFFCIDHKKSQKQIMLTDGHHRLYAFSMYINSITKFDINSVTEMKQTWTFIKKNDKYSIEKDVEIYFDTNYNNGNHYIYFLGSDTHHISLNLDNNTTIDFHKSKENIDVYEASLSAVNPLHYTYTVENLKFYDTQYLLVDLRNCKFQRINKISLTIKGLDYDTIYVAQVNNFNNLTDRNCCQLDDKWKKYYANKTNKELNIDCNEIQNNSFIVLKFNKKKQDSKKQSNIEDRQG